MPYPLKTILCSVALSLSAVAIAQEQNNPQGGLRDSTRQITILFPFDKAVVDSGFANNARALEELRRIMTNESVAPELYSIVVTGAASPEGAPPHNRWLAMRRANSLRNYIIQNFPFLDNAIVRARVDGLYWEPLVEVLQRNSSIPWGDELLAVLGDPTLSDETKNLRMSTMRGGETFAYLRDDHILRRMRKGSASVKFHLLLRESEPAPEPMPAPAEPAGPEVQLPPAGVVDTLEHAPRCTVTYPVALRTNLLLDVVGGPNLGIVIPIGRHFSVGIDGAYAYTRIKNTYALQTIRTGVEASYWFNPRRNPLTGWNAGIYAAYCSRFDVQWGSGVQGDGYLSAGVSAGYSWRLSDSFNLGVSLMGGYLYSSEVREYSAPRDGHLIWEKTIYNVGRPALTQVRIDLVWLINKKRWE
jgi:hypothetical protein